jgi:hypothetical protein
MDSSRFRPLVVGAPRSGFALLASVVNHFAPVSQGRWTVAQEVFNALVEALDPLVARAVTDEFTAAGVTSDLIFNPNFRKITGGPKWLRADAPDLACFRKYVGVRGLGDFTLVTSHPREILDTDFVVHSHVDPGTWLHHPAYAEYTKFASLRNPIGILNSSVFSINALASEYIQRFVPAEDDNDLMRQKLALYKLTDEAFLRGLVEFLVGYLTEFARHWRAYHVMRWEDLILLPVPTILQLAGAAGIALSEQQAQQIWSRLDHVNLTGNHLHNYRSGKGIVGNWREWLVNEHFELFASMGLEPLMVELGYGRLPRLRESEYTDFQKKVSDHLRRGEICRETQDEDLFTFAFNKSNIVSNAFPFTVRPWRTWTRIERSIFRDEALEQRVSDAAEDMTGRVNGVLQAFLDHPHQTTGELKGALATIEQEHAALLALVPKRAMAGFSKARETLERAEASGNYFATNPAAPFYHQPMLIDTIDTYNIVAFQERYLGVPQGLGSIRLEELSLLPAGVISGRSFVEVSERIALARQGHVPA